MRTGRFDEHANIPQVSGSLFEVLDSFESDHDYLFEGGVFIGDLIETWIEWKRVNEVDLIWLRLYFHEFELYFDI